MSTACVLLCSAGFAAVPKIIVIVADDCQPGQPVVVSVDPVATDPDIEHVKGRSVLAIQVDAQEFLKLGALINPF